ncbi:MAG: hypothetical protein Q9182_003587 [Xanthomendoza sp. 2 TL-2023]
MAPKRAPLTHFLCLPLTSGQAAAQWQASLQYFATDVAGYDAADAGASASASHASSAATNTVNPSVAESNTSNPAPTHTSTSIGSAGLGGDVRRDRVPAKAVRPLGTLHLTVGVMSLEKPERVEGAVGLLRGLDLGVMLGVRKGDGKGEGPEGIHGAGKSMGTDSMDPPTPTVSTNDDTGKPDEKTQAKNANPNADRATQTSEAAMPTKVSPPPMCIGQRTSPSLSLSFTGLKSMHQPKSTSFLYTAPTDDTGRLYPFCQSLKDRFTREGLMTEENRELKLHATVLNTIYAGKVYPSSKLVQGQESRFEVTKTKDSGAEGRNVEGGLKGEQYDGDNIDGGSRGDEAQADNTPAPKHHPQIEKAKKKFKRKKQQVLKFDARDLISRYGEFEWARDVRIEKVAICEMGAKKIMDEKGEVVGEEYTEVASVALP